MYSSEQANFIEYFIGTKTSLGTLQISVLIFFCHLSKKHVVLETLFSAVIYLY